jgi:transcription elongation factor Elf1
MTIRTNNYSDWIDRISEGPKMSSETWKSFCLTISNMKGYVPQVSQPHVLGTFKCDKCGMEVATGMKLDGILHRAILNACGGCWREQPKGNGSQPPSAEGEYEIDDSV